MNLKSLLGQDKRTVLMRKNIAVSFLIKGWSGVVTLLLVPATLNCLGEYKNGIWLTVSSMLIWIDNLDIGLGNGLRNQLASCLAHDEHEKAREAITTTFVMLALIIIPITILALCTAYAIDLYRFLNVDSQQIGNLEAVVAVSIILVAGTFIFKFIGNVYLGLQLPAINNLLVTIGHTLALIGTYAVYFCGSRSLMHIAVVNTAAPLLTYLIAYPYTFRQYPHLRPSLRYFSRPAVRSLLTIGLKFFVLQIAGILLFMSSNILISRIFNPSLVTPYQIAYRYFSIVILIFTVISTPYWTATTDAWERGDLAWIRHSRRSMDKILILMALMLVVMVLVSTPVYRVWVGSEVEIPFSMSVLMALYMLVILISLSYSYYINGVGALMIQLVCTVLAALLFIPVTYAAVGYVSRDINTILITMTAINLPGMVLNKIQYEKIINAGARGIWLR